MPSRRTANPELTADTPVYSVRRLNREAKRLLETGLPGLWVGGEISGFLHHGSGHMYFTLKDAHAEVRCAMFKGAQRGMRFKPGNGQQVVLQGTVSIYEARGSYQIIVDRMEEAGEGLLRRQFEELKARLQAEGLFATEHKQSLPALPSCIGVVTSPTGAAVRDILNILQRRYPLADVVIYPARVQGTGAREEIAAAIARANQRNECDVLIVARGGGSLEDLWCFNEEVVARAIFASQLPVIAGIGHEVDVTIADLVADVRAPTPSGAAELIVPDRTSLKQVLRDAERRAGLSMQRYLHASQTHVKQLDARLQRTHPGAVLRELQQRADELTRALSKHLQRILEQQRNRCTGLQQRLTHASPASRVTALAELRQRLALQLSRAMQHRLSDRRTALAALAGNLQAVSPLATLERGYAIVRQPGSDTVIRHAAALEVGAEIEAQLADGVIAATVTAKPPPK